MDKSRKVTTAIVVIIVAVLIAGISYRPVMGTFLKRAGEKLAADSVSDPSTAQFRNVIVSGTDDPTVCGEINTKNAYGAYAGFTRFFSDGVVLAFIEPPIPTIEQRTGMANPYDISAYDFWQRSWIDRCSDSNLVTDPAIAALIPPMKEIHEQMLKRASAPPVP